jgi:predicted DNA-binding transcriptional regulator AlpA|tara:strand:+ start:730 stop:1059 length:330 start_codon:yes stop_codon:yes gene_type:complete
MKDILFEKQALPRTLDSLADHPQPTDDSRSLPRYGDGEMSGQYRVMKMKQVTAEVCLSRSRIHYLQKRNEFPQPILLHPNGRATVYLRSEIEAWLQGRIDARRGGALCG